MIQMSPAPLTLDNIAELLFGGKKVALGPADLDRVRTNFDFLKEFSANKLIYGINTGLGPMAQYKISQGNGLQLQYNLIRSHSSGAGAPLSPILVKALMIARLNSLLQGYSGVHPDTIELLQILINKEIYPIVPEHGGVGASGDLVQLAHVALVMIGEGEVIYESTRQETAAVFSRLGITPLKIYLREGLGIVNGTSAMTGIGLVNLLLAKKVLACSVLFSAMTNEVVSAFDDHFSGELNSVKKHTGQNIIASRMRDILSDSKMIRKRSDHLYNAESIEQDVFEDKIQEYYSVRCITQVLGPIHDTIAYAEEVVLNELNSANDNPVIDHVRGDVYHGGNFHGDYVSLEMDKLKIAITKCSMLSERQLNFLLNDKLNNKFPPFLNLGTLGLHFGMQGIQFTATSTVAENQTLSFPMYLHSIPNNNDNQDIVSMGCNAALMTRKVLDNTLEILSVQIMAIVQAIDSLSCQTQLSSQTRAVYNTIRSIFPVFIEDHPKYADLLKIKTLLMESDLFM